MIPHESADLLDYLDQVPDKLYARIVTLQYRSSDISGRWLQLRCNGLMNIRQHLLQGRIISKDKLLDWMLVEDAEILYTRLSNTDLLAASINNSHYTDSILLNIIDWLDQASELKSRLDQGISLQPVSDSNSRTRKPSQHSANNHTVDSHNSSSGAIKQYDEADAAVDQSYHTSNQQIKPASPESSDDKRAYIKQANSSLSQALTSLDDQNQIAIDKAMLGINQSFAIQRQLGSDLNKGIASTGDIRDLLRLHKTIKSSNYLQSIIKLIGRAKLEKKSRTKIPGLNQQDYNDNGPGKYFTDSDLINDVSGIHYGDDLSRMLASQLIMLGHPQLRGLWLARRAERQLLNYHIQGVLSDHAPDFSDSSIDTDSSGIIKYQQQGPMLVCLDTSASMKGKPETLAKAITLETMRVARLEKRACYAFAFSGKSELSEFDLDLNARGWSPILNFLNSSFHGGTDIESVLLEAYRKIKDMNMKRADILLVSDGRFNLEKSDTLLSLQRDLPQIRIFGLQVGQWKSTGFGDICHRVFDFSYV